MANLQTGRDARLVGNRVPKGGVWPAGNSMPIDRPWRGARYDDLIDGWAHERVGKSRRLCHFQEYLVPSTPQCCRVSVRVRFTQVW